MKHIHRDLPMLEVWTSNHTTHVAFSTFGGIAFGIFTSIIIANFFIHFIDSYKS
jgi:hypothetical protein